jgi:low molecular weight phosphotyrosine protein phosphatase
MKLPLRDSKVKEKTVLFVCVENAGRSQMAEGLFRKYAPKGYLAISAGTMPSEQINPVAIQVMREIGIDVSKQASSKPTILPTGKYDITDAKFPWMKGTLIVTESKNDDKSNLIIGGFYTPTNQVANKLDNDGGSHPGWLGYYINEFPKNGFSISSKYNFHYAACKYCPGGYWPDQQTADHTLIIYTTNQPLSEAISKLSKMVWNNVYI